MSLVFAAVVICLGHHAKAEFIPPNLPEGSQYQPLFMTYDAMPATSANISLYNAFVTAEAALNPSLPSGVTWTAVVSTPTINANVNAPSGSLLVFNTQGAQLTSQTMGLYAGQGLLADVISDQYGNTAPLTGNFGPNVWTGTNAFGYTNFQGTPVGGDPNGFANQGYATDFVANQWINFTESGPLTTAYHIYALSSPITVVPEPSTIVLIIAAVIAFGLRGRLFNCSLLKVVAAIAVLPCLAGTGQASPLTYDIGPLFATNGDEILGTVAIANNTTVTSLTWEVLSGTQKLAGASSNSRSTISGFGFTINGTSLLFPVLGNANIQYSTPFGSPISPPSDDFTISTYSDGSGQDKYGLEIEAGSDLYPFGAGYSGIWYVDISNTLPSQPYLIATQAVPEPASLLLLASAVLVIGGRWIVSRAKEPKGFRSSN
jgi:hypothetical protein